MCLFVSVFSCALSSVLLGSWLYEHFSLLDIE
jgi:hypothetical protein